MERVDAAPRHPGDELAIVREMHREALGILVVPSHDVRDEGAPAERRRDAIRRERSELRRLDARQRGRPAEREARAEALEQVVGAMERGALRGACDHQRRPAPGACGAGRGARRSAKLSSRERRARARGAPGRRSRVPRRCRGTRRRSRRRPRRLKAPRPPPRWRGSAGRGRRRPRPAEPRPASRPGPRRARAPQSARARPRRARDRLAPASSLSCARHRTLS